MKNTNYNVLKLLHNQLDDLWRIERFYLKDAENLDCACAKIFEEMRGQMQENIEKLKAELDRHQTADQLA